METNTISNRWQQYVLETLTQAKIWVFAVLYLGLFRLFMMLFYHNKIGTEVDFADFLGAVLHGFRFGGRRTIYPVTGKPPALPGVFPLLDKTIVNPYRSLYYAVKDYKEVTSTIEHSANIYQKDRTIIAAAESYFGNGDSNDLHSYLKKFAPGTMIEMPEHIFLVVMESYDSWPLQEKYQLLGVVDRVKNIAHNGIMFKNFLPSGTLTFSSLAALVTGVPYVGINISRINDTGREPFIVPIR